MEDDTTENASKQNIISRKTSKPASPTNVEKARRFKSADRNVSISPIFHSANSITYNSYVHVGGKSNRVSQYSYPVSNQTITETSGKSSQNRSSVEPGPFKSYGKSAHSASQSEQNIQTERESESGVYSIPVKKVRNTNSKTSNLSGHSGRYYSNPISKSGSSVEELGRSASHAGDLTSDGTISPTDIGNIINSTSISNHTSRNLSPVSKHVTSKFRGFQSQETSKDKGLHVQTQHCNENGLQIQIQIQLPRPKTDCELERFDRKSNGKNKHGGIASRFLSPSGEQSCTYIIADDMGKVVDSTNAENDIQITDFERDEYHEKYIKDTVMPASPNAASSSTPYHDKYGAGIDSTNPSTVSTVNSEKHTPDIRLADIRIIGFSGQEPPRSTRFSAGVQNPGLSGQETPKSTAQSSGIGNLELSRHETPPESGTRVDSTTKDTVMPESPNAASSSPPGVVCHICGRRYGSSSINIHVKNCLHNWHTENDAMSEHLRKPVPVPHAIDGSVPNFGIISKASDGMYATRYSRSFHSFNEASSHQQTGTDQPLYSFDESPSQYQSEPIGQHFLSFNEDSSHHQSEPIYQRFHVFNEASSNHQSQPIGPRFHSFNEAVSNHQSDPGQQFHSFNEATSHHQSDRSQRFNSINEAASHIQSEPIYQRLHSFNEASSNIQSDPGPRFHRFNETSSPHQSDPDQRATCPMCGRTFLPDKLQMHVKSCDGRTYRRKYI